MRRSSRSLRARRGHPKRKRKSLKAAVVMTAPFVWFGMAVEGACFLLAIIVLRAGCAFGWHLWLWESSLRVTCYETGAWRCFSCDAIKVRSGTASSKVTGKEEA